MSERLVRTASHWGAFWVQVRDGRAVGVKPFEKDEHPSPLAQSQVEAVYDKSRIDRPHVRKGFLDHGAKSDLMESRAAFAEKRKPNFKGWKDPADRHRLPTLDEPEVSATE